MDKRTHALLIAALATGTSHGQDLRSGSADNLNLSGAWVDTTAPGTTETATWNASSSLTNTLGANLTWAGLNVSGATAAVSISGANTLTAGALNLGANNLSLTTSAANNSLNLRSLSGTGNLTINNGAANLGVTAFNTANALNFNGTLTLRGGNAATTPASSSSSVTRSRREEWRPSGLSLPSLQEAGGAGSSDRCRQRLQVHWLRDRSADDTGSERAECEWAGLRERARWALRLARLVDQCPGPPAREPPQQQPRRGHLAELDRLAFAANLRYQRPGPHGCLS